MPLRRFPKKATQVTTRVLPSCLILRACLPMATASLSLKPTVQTRPSPGHCQSLRLRFWVRLLRPSRSTQPGRLFSKKPCQSNSTASKPMTPIVWVLRALKKCVLWLQLTLRLLLWLLKRGRLIWSLTIQRQTLTVFKTRARKASQHQPRGSISIPSMRKADLWPTR